MTGHVPNASAEILRRASEGIPSSRTKTEWTFEEMGVIVRNLLSNPFLGPVKAVGRRP